VLDEHTVPANWGILPNIFGINTYTIFVLLGLAAGIYVYYLLAKKEKSLGDNTFYIAVAALVGGTLGAKLPIWIINYKAIIAALPNPMAILSGRTITGGLIGGTLAVMYVKHKLGIREKRGNLFAPGIALGVAIGRIGCFLRGCCYGIHTSLPWGVDFGDGPRHPTQLYEAIFMLGMFFYLITRKKAKPGQLFFILMNSYFVFRFFIEFIRDNPHYFGLTLFQYISVAALLFINGKYYIEQKQGKKNGKR